MSSTSSQGGERGEGIVDVVAAGRVISAQHQQDDSMTTANNNNNNNNTTTSKKSLSSSTSYYTTNRSTTSSGRPYTRTSSFHSAMSGITTATEDFASCVEQESDIDSMESMNDNTTNKFSIIMESIHDNDDNNDDDEDNDSHNSRSNNNNRRGVQKGKGNYNCNDKHICISEEEEEVIEKDGIQRIVDRIPTEKKTTTATSIPIVITVDDNDNSIDSDNSAAAASTEDNKEDKEEDDDNDNDDDGEEEFNNTNHIRQQTHQDQSQKHQQIVAKDDDTTPITNKNNVNNKNTNEKQLEATKLIYTKSKAIVSWGKSVPVVSLFVNTTETVASVIVSATCNTSLQQLDTQIETYLVPTINQRIVTPIVKTINTGNAIVRVFLSPFLVATKLLENKTKYDGQTTINEETTKATTPSKPPQPAVAAARYYFTSTDIEQETNYMFKY